MDIISKFRKLARKNKKRIVLPRASDERVLKAALHLTTEGLADVILIKDHELAAEIGGITMIDPKKDARLKDYAKSFYERRKHKGLSLEEAEKIIQDPLYFAASMVAHDDADGCVAGSIATTGDVIKAAIHAIGLKGDSKVVSSVFLMSFENGKVFTYGDCAVVPYPDEDQLASICVDSAYTHQTLIGSEPKVAMLSFSTKGSAKHDRVELVSNACKKAQNQAPNLHIDGELQFDAAFMDEIAKRKAPESTVAGQANVYIFPNLDAGNIAYKITERLGHATATGPIIQGLAKPMMDLSRGCSWEDIVNTVCVCSILANTPS
jgi:phosphate acetyltransferase